MNHRYDFTIEKNVTAVYQQYAQLHPAIRELRCMEQMYPASFCPIQQGDLFAGRIQMPLIGFSPEPGGLGYYCDAPAIRRKLEENEYSVPERAEVEELLRFWENRTTSCKVRAAFPEAVAEALPSDDWTGTPLAAAPLYRMAGSYLDYETLLTLGIPGLREKIASRAESAGPEEKILLLSMADALSLLGKCCLAYAAEAEDMGKSDLAAILRKLPDSKPQTMREAIQLMWLYILISGTYNYGRVDDLLGEFLKRDLENGTLTMETAQELLNGFWQLIADRKTIWNGRVILGGKGRKHPESADLVAWMGIEASRVIEEVEPQLTLRVYEGMNPKLMEKALETIGQGRTYPMLYNDDVNIPAVANAFRVSMEEAEDYVPFGCGEYVLNHRSYGSPNGIINLLKVLEITLHNGFDGVTGRKAGLETGKWESFRDFSELWEAYTKQTEYFVNALAQAEEIEYTVTGTEAPFLFLSMLYDDCIERAKGIFSGGIRYLGGTVETYGNVNTADSLTAIRELVYEKRTVTPEQLMKALDADFVGFEELQKQLKAVSKYGNDAASADEMAKAVHEHICNTVRNQIRNTNLHSYLVVIINNSANTTLGENTAASADGRCCGVYMANANNPWGGNDKKGLTAMLNSLVKLRPDLHAGAVQNMKLSPELFAENGKLVKSILKAYFANGGTQAMISVVNRNDLEQAMIHPERYSHLFVRVGGFSARFIELERHVQLEILSRTLY